MKLGQNQKPNTEQKKWKSETCRNSRKVQTPEVSLDTLAVTLCNKPTLSNFM